MVNAMLTIEQTTGNYPTIGAVANQEIWSISSKRYYSIAANHVDLRRPRLVSLGEVVLNTIFRIHQMT